MIKLVPWCYIYNLVGHVLHYWNNSHSTGFLTDPHFIPSNKVFLKIGGDHGGCFFKTSFQIANTDHPNNAENTVLFSIMEAKDSKANLLLCLQRFKTYIAQFSQVKWLDKSLRIFLFGDYEFLCSMYGISGACGRHPCLWCHIISNMLNVPLAERFNLFSKPSLYTLKGDHTRFIDIYRG